MAKDAWYETDYGPHMGIYSVQHLANLLKTKNTSIAAIVVIITLGGHPANSNMVYTKR